MNQSLYTSKFDKRFSNQHMTLIQHTDENVRFSQQAENAKNYLIPFMEGSVKIHDKLSILDIGCGDGGVLIPFLEKGCQCTGIELDQIKFEFAKKFLAEYINKGQAEIVHQNIYEEKALEKYAYSFDLIILKDVIEHIPDQKKFIPYLKKFLKPNGMIFFGFPPWQMPHGGHQQICSNKFLTMLPWFHLLPPFIYKGILKLFGEYDEVIKELLEIKSTGISIE
ncbi:MAG: class I SAM-dependent methyltransferase, partial [Chitinophagaceae bacterium]